MSRYNKRREDFASDKEYDDYLEEVEDISKHHCTFLQPSRNPSSRCINTCRLDELIISVLSIKRGHTALTDPSLQPSQ